MSGSAAQKATTKAWSYMRTNANVAHPWRIDPRWQNKFASVDVYKLSEPPLVGAQWRRLVFPVSFLASYGAYVACYNAETKKWFRNPASFQMSGVHALPLQVPTHYGLPLTDLKSLEITLNRATGRPDQPIPVEEEEAKV